MESNLQRCCLEIFCIYSDDSFYRQDLRCYGLISLKTFLLFPMSFSDFKSDAIEKQGIINLCKCSSKSYASVVLSDFKVTFLGEEEDAIFLHFSIVFCWYMALHDRGNRLLNWRKWKINKAKVGTSKSKII